MLLLEAWMTMPEPTPVLPEVLAQIRGLPVSDRPLIICDVDEVILHLIAPLEAYLADNGLRFLSHSYRFTGNIAPIGTNTPVPADQVRNHLMTFFDTFTHRQTMVTHANTVLEELSADWDIVLLTNLPGAHNKPARETLLGGMGIPYPVLTNSGPKGGAVAALAGGRSQPVVFIDDSPTNHSSVQATLPASIQIQFIADDRFLKLVEPEPHIDLLTGDWRETSRFIRDIL